MQSATALARWACTKMKAHPVGKLRLLGKSRRLNELCFCAELRLLGKSRRLNELCFCAALNCRF